MTDNRTTELLREGLTEHGIEWRSGLEGVTFVGDWCFVEYDNGKLAATCEPVLTSEQAIAATLGSEYHGYEQAAIEAWESIKAWNTRAANDTLTAEQVREAIEANSWAETSTIREFNDSSWQAIADELNAVIGGGECEIKQHRCTSCDREINDDAYYVRVNLGNGAWTAESRHANFCPNCGAKVVGE